MPLEGNQVITACRENTLLNQCPLISGDFFGVKYQETINPHNVSTKTGRIN